MARIIYNPGDKVIVTDPVGPEAVLGKILTIKKKMNDKHNTYYFEEIRSCLASHRFQRYYPSTDSEPGGKYNGWPNRETDEAALVLFNDRSLLDVITDALIISTHARIPAAVKVIRRIPLSCGDSAKVCVRSILEQWCQQSRSNQEMTVSHFRIVLSELQQYDYIEPSLVDQAQAIADHVYNAAESFQAVADGLKPEQEITQIMKIETKHFVNDQDIARLTLEEKVALIKNTEDKIAELQAIKTKSKMVSAEIIKLQAFLEKAVALFDDE